MAAKKTAKTKAKDLPAAVEDLTRAILLNSDFEHPWKRLGMAFGRGAMYSLGLITVVAVIIPLAVWFLGRFDWVPIIGDFFGEVGKRIEEAQSSR